MHANFGASNVIARRSYRVLCVCVFLYLFLVNKSECLIAFCVSCCIALFFYCDVAGRVRGNVCKRNSDPNHHCLKCFFFFQSKSQTILGTYNPKQKLCMQLFCLEWYLCVQ